MSALDFGGGSNTNASNRGYTLSGPEIHNGDFAVLMWFRANTAPSASTVMFSTALNPNSNEGVATFIYNAVTPPNQIAAYGNGNSSGGSVALIWNDVPPFDNTDVLLVVQRNGSTFERYMVNKGDTIAAPQATRAWVGGVVAAGTWHIGRYWDDTFGWIFPLGEFAFLPNVSLSAAQVTTLAAGVRPTAANAGEDPLILFGFRGDGSASTETNLGTGGATYDATRSGTGFTTTTEFFPLGGAPRLTLLGVG